VFRRLNLNFKYEIEPANDRNRYHSAGHTASNGPLLLGLRDFPSEQPALHQHGKSKWPNSESILVYCKLKRMS